MKALPLIARNVLFGNPDRTSVQSREFHLLFAVVDKRKDLYRIRI